MERIKWLLTILVAAFALFLFTPSSVLAADATIAGTVTHDSDGTPVETLLIYAENYDTGNYSYAYTAADGTYTITIDDAVGATAGDYIVYNYSITSTETGVVFIRNEQTVTLTEGEAKTGVDMSVVRRAKMQGYVYESDGVTPVYNAYVYMVRTTTWNDGYTADYSAASGFYTDSPTPYPDTTRSAIGDYTVTISAYGYFSASDTASLSADETTLTQDFTLTPGSTISGTVTDKNGDPVSGATVTALQTTKGYSYNAQTASDGTYTVLIYDQYSYNGTAVGDYKITVSKDGYVNKTDSVSITADDSALTGQDMSLQTAGSLTGTVFENDGVTPIDNVTVTATDGLGNSYSTTSESSGVYTFSNLRASTHYTLSYTATGFVAESLYEQTVVLSETTTVDDVRLKAAVTFEGTVVSKTGSDPIFGATVKLFNRAKPRSSSADYSVTSLTDGSFSFTGVAPGKYRLEIVQTGFETFKKNLVSLKNDVSGKTYKMERAAAVSGRVTVGGNPVHNALVTVYSKNPVGVGYGSVYTDANGYYRIASLKPGKYTIKVSGMAYVEKIVRKKLSQGKTTNLNIKVGEAGSISGIVQDSETGLPLAGYTVRVRHQTVSASTDSNGYYIIDGLAPGKYKAYIISTAYETANIGNIKVRSNKEMDDVNFQLDPK